jgi:hypothetical protein
MRTRSACFDEVTDANCTNYDVDNQEQQYHGVLPVTVYSGRFGRSLENIWLQQQFTLVVLTFLN